MPKFPEFNSYACVGDSISWESGGFTLTATLHADNDCSPLDLECYSPIKIKQWCNDEWFYVGVVISVSKNGVAILDNAASLWGVECNFNSKANRYLSTVAKELESEAVELAMAQVEHILKALAC